MRNTGVCKRSARSSASKSPRTRSRGSSGPAPALSPGSDEWWAPFAQFVADRDLPVDFVSRHAYTSGPAQHVPFGTYQTLRPPQDLLDQFADELDAVELPGGDTFCHAIGSAIEQDGTVPLAPLITGLLSFLAVTVDPSSAAGPHTAPFANLTWDHKAEVWRRFEEDLPALIKPAPFLLEVPIVSAAVELAETAGGVLEYSARRLGRITVAPGVGVQVPADLGLPGGFEGEGRAGGRDRLEQHGAETLPARALGQQPDAVHRVIQGHEPLDPGERLVAVGFGAERPIADNSTAEGRAQNRRTEFKIAAVNGNPYRGVPLDGGGTEFR